jgi:hypothetical protein
MSLRQLMLGGGALLVSSLMGSSPASAAGVLGWSHTATAVGVCTTTPCVEGSTLTYQIPEVEQGVNMNATSSSSNATFGVANASTGVGAGEFDLPQLKGDVTTHVAPGGFGFSYAVMDGLQGYRWDGLTGIAMGVDTFRGFVDFTTSAEGFGYVNASIAIISGELRGTALGDAWYRFDSNYGFVSDCSTQGAVALGSTGVNTTKGGVSAVVSPSCGAETFWLNPGEEFFVWARMGVFHAGNGYTDASHTFSVQLSPDLSDDVRLALTQNLVVTPGFAVTAVPEPNIWALMILGIGAVGAALRRRRPFLA